MLGQDLLDLFQTANVKSALVRRKGARERRSGLVIVKLEELLAGKLVIAVLTLSPLIEFAANAVDPVVDAFAVVRRHQHRLEQLADLCVRLNGHLAFRAALRADKGLHIANRAARTPGDLAGLPY